MIVNRSMAEDASKELLIHTFFLCGLEEHHVHEAYRSRARETHPDQPGGSAEGFVAVDRAKHVLLEWLKRGDDAIPVLEARKCPACNGEGTKIMRHGFGGMKVQCNACRGTGDADYDHNDGGE